jgi:hypothetical protein
LELAQGFRGGYPTPGFLAKSAELRENKGVEFFGNAKRRKRVRKSMKRKRIGDREWDLVKQIYQLLLKVHSQEWLCHEKILSDRVGMFHRLAMLLGIEDVIGIWGVISRSRWSLGIEMLGRISS